MVVRGFHKKASKRISTKKRVKVERKIADHHRKARKEARKVPKKAKLKRKDPGVPNSLPFKDDILKEAKRLRAIKDAEKEAAKQRRKDARAAARDAKRNLSTLAQDAESRTAEYEETQEFVTEQTERLGTGKKVEGSLKAYSKEFKKVVEAADVILEVLDARDPLGSRCPQVEQAVISAGVSKKLVLLLNKIDLVPKENVEAWLKYLRNELPTVAFKSSTQTQKSNLSRSKVPVAKATSTMMKSSACFGADVLLKLMANYSRQKDLKTAIRVGVVGFPNTGKSSLINSLKRSKACVVGNTPGVTKTMQEVQLDKTVRLLDCPGIVMASGDSEMSTMLRNAVKVEQIEDPVAPVETILSRCRKDQMMMQYKLSEYKDTTDFLNLLAKRFGMLKKGGIPDIAKAARIVLQDWNSGKITYYTQPPETHSLPSHLSAQVVTEMSHEFDIDALRNEEQEYLEGGCNAGTGNIMLVDSEGLTAGEEMGDTDSDEEMDDESAKKSVKTTKGTPLKNVVVSDLPKRKTRLSVALAARSPVTSEEMQMNKQVKKQMKKIKKQRRRADKVATDLSNALELGLAGVGSDDYEEKDISL